MIELYIDDSHTQFKGGVYYDAENVPHEMKCVLHTGVLTDSCLIVCDGDILCRYFPYGSRIEFYGKVLDDKVLIHNDGKEVIEVHGFGVLRPGESKVFVGDGEFG